MLLQWLSVQALFPDRASHKGACSRQATDDEVALLSYEHRRAARERAKLDPNLARLFDLERRLRPGEAEEPMGLLLK